MNFGDAEIISLELQRGGGRSLVVATVGPGVNKRVTFVLDDWIDVALNGFSNQNVIGGLAIRLAGQRAVENWELGVRLQPGKHEIVLSPIFGAYGVIRATITRIEMADRRGADRTP